MEAFIVSALRSPIGKFLGGLSSLTAPKLGAAIVREQLSSVGIQTDEAKKQIDEVIFGNVVQAGVGQNPARQIALHAGLPDTIAAYTVNKVCGSGLKAVMLAVQAIRAGDGNRIIAGGIESMSNAPHLLPNSRQGFKYGETKLIDALVQDGLWCPFENWPMGQAAESIAKRYNITRSEQDRIALQSHQRAASAWEKNHFAEEVRSITSGSGNRVQKIEKDEGIRVDTSMESLAKLKPAFDTQGTVTAGNASQLSDGAASIYVVSEKALKEERSKPLARVVAYATSGVAPKDIFLAPVSAIQKVLQSAKLDIKEIDLFEINEAFAVQLIACMKLLELDERKVNVNGGAIALGHPIGASGARVLVTLVHSLIRDNKRYGLATLCLGGGNAVAMIIERV